MASLKVSRGDKILCHGEIAEVIAWLAPDRLNILYIRSKRFDVISADQIDDLIDKPVLTTTFLDKSPDLLDFSESQIEEAQRRYNIISEHLVDGVSKVQVVSQVAKEMGLSVSRAYHVLAQYSKDSSLISLIGDRPGCKPGVVRLPDQLESIIQDAILHVKGPKATVTEVLKKVRHACYNAGVAPPAYKAVRARLNQSTPKERTAQLYGHKKADQDHTVKAKVYPTNAPLELVQMDHCIVDMIIVDELHRKPLGRPWLTLAIDVHTRVVLGFYLTLDHPSSLSNAMCMIHAVQPKQPWLKNIGMDHVEYPFYGKPRRIHVDNGKDFRSAAFISGCSQNDIRLTYRPPATPHHGAHVERYIGTLMRSIRGLPGSTMSNVADLKRYSNLDGPSMTFKELRDWITEQVGIYHKTEHRTLRCAPIYMWEKSLRQPNGCLTSPELIRDAKKFVIDFLPFKRVSVQRGGIRVNTIDYYSPALKMHSIKTRCIVKYNPASLARVWVKLEGVAEYIECTYADVRFRDISLAEFKLIKKELSRSSSARACPSEVFAAVERNEARAAKSMADTRSARLAAEKNKNRPTIDRDDRGNATPSRKIDYGVQPRIYEAE